MTFVVVGAGISGLSAALRLREHGETLILEASDRIGGKLRTTSVDGVQVEAGADSFIVRDDELVNLCRSLGLGDRLVEPAVFGGLVSTPGGLKPLPAGTILGVPMSPAAALKAAALSPAGKLRALADLILPGPLGGDDVAVGPFIRKRFGAEVADRLVDPLLAGTRAGSPEQMSLAAALPQIDKAARSTRSVMRGLPTGGSKPRFVTLRDGMESLAGAMAAGLDVRTGTAVRSITPTGDAFTLTLDDEEISAEAVVLAVPAHAAAPLLQQADRETAERLRTIRYASVASIVAVFDRTVDLPAGSSGVLLSSKHPGHLSAATWWSKKWPHTSRGRTVIRCFVGRSERDPLLDRSDDDVGRIALGELSTVIGSLPEPTATAVHRWDDGLPQYRVGHLDLVEEIERALPPGMALAGAGYRGSGIPDCHRSGVAAAERVLAGSHRRRS